MKLPLLLGARPKYCGDMQLRHLGEGKWKIYTEGVLDTKLSLSTSESATSVPLNGEALTLTGPLEVYLKIDAPGKEAHFHVFAEQVK